MELLKSFETAAATVIGVEHANVGKNGHDAYRVFSSDSLIAGVVCDGCSSGAHSEVGANLGAELVLKNVVDTVRRFPDSSKITAENFPWMKIQCNVNANLRILAASLGTSLSKISEDYFLFSVIGFIVLPHITIVYGVGDGIYDVNGIATQVGPFEGNAPPYLAYGGLVESTLELTNPKVIQLQAWKVIPTVELNSVLVGTDGLIDVYGYENASEPKKKMPGMDETFGPFDQFWKKNAYFEIPDNLRRRLFLANRTSAKLIRDGAMITGIKKEVGILHDDTTLVVVRRKPVTEVQGAKQ